MKRLAVAFISCILILTACSQMGVSPETGTSKVPQSTQDTQSAANAAEAGVSDYFPFEKDVHMKFRGIGNEYAEYETYVEYVKNDLIQLRNLNPGTISVMVYQLKDGILKKVYMQGEIYYRYDFTSFTNQDEILIKEPIKEGTSWTLSDGSSRSITAVDRQITTPSGDFKALEITTIRKESTQKDYYVKNTGHVKTEFISDGYTVTSEVEKIEKNMPLKQKVRFYFPEFSESRVVYIDRDIEIFTNEDMKFKFQKELKTIPDSSGLTKVLTPGVKVLGSKIDEEKGIVTVDFSSELLSEMNAGTLLESLLVKSITNTFGNYYGKEKVIITIEGKLYESGHILLEQGQYFEVETENVPEYR